jgi:transposase
MQRSEIIRVERCRRWRLSEKQEIVAETLQPRASVSAIVQRYGLHPSQLFAWRKAARDGRLIEESEVSFCTGDDRVGARGPVPTSAGFTS